jgi:uroporphyrinogen decarboxylase
MDSRERYVRAIKFEGPDRAPITHHYLPGALRVHGARLEELYARYPEDNLGFSFGEERIYGSEPGLPGVDRWGCVWLRHSDDADGQAIGHPLAEWTALDTLKAPEPFEGTGELEQMAAEIQEEGHRRYVSANAGSLWPRMFFLRGYDAILLDIAEGREEVICLRALVTDYILKRVEILGRHDLDAIGMGDDWGFQTALMTRPDTWRQVFKPAYRRIVEAIHSTGKFAHFHTDGYTLEIIPDLIEIGFDELNPQVWCMDVEELGRLFRSQTCFRPDLDRQWLLPRGTPADIEAYIHRAFAALGMPKGGFVCWGEVAADTPIENVEAMLRTFWTLRY